MILVDIIVAFAFITFIGLFYKSLDTYCCDFFTKYSFGISRSFEEKEELYKKLQKDLEKTNGEEQKSKIEKVIANREKEISRIIEEYARKEKEYEGIIENRMNGLKDYYMKSNEVSKKVQKHLNNVNFDVKPLILKFANLYKKRHNIEN